MRPVVLVCDHATNFIPAEMFGLGLGDSQLQKHIAWDIGAAGVTRVLAEMLDAPAVYSEVSRLVVDCNRVYGRPDMMPEMSDGIAIPGNKDLTGEQRYQRIIRWFNPYHDAIEAVTRAQAAEPVFVSIHSMTQVMAGQERPWQISLSSFQDRRLTDPILAALRARGDITVGDNEPYDVDPNLDYTTPAHAFGRGLLNVQVEFRQDEVASAKQQRAWAERFAGALRIGLDSIDSCSKPGT